MPDQLTPPSLSARTPLSTLLRGMVKANLIHHLAHTGGEAVLRRIGRAYAPPRDWLPHGEDSLGPQGETILRGLAQACATPTPELTPDNPGVRALEEAARADPEALWAWVGLGLNYLRLWDGDAYFAKARECFARASALRPAWAWGPLLQGEAERSLLDYRASLASYERAIALDPGFAWAYAFKARVLFQVGADKRDLRWMEEAIRLAPREGWMYAWRAESLRRLGRSAAAERDFRKGLRLDPLYDQAYCWRAKLLEAKGRHRQAVASLKKGLALCPSFEKAYRALFKVLRDSGDAAGALRVLNTAAGLNHRNDWLGNWRVEGAPDDAQSRRALAGLDALILKRPRDPWPLAWRGEAKGQLGRRESALADLDAALRLKPDLAWAQCWRGEALLKLGRPEEAAAAFDEALRLDPSYGRAWAWRGRAHADAGRWEKACADYDRALSARRVEYAWISAWRGQAELALGRSGDALRDLDAAVLLDSRNRVFRAWRAQARRAAGDERGGREDLLRAAGSDFPWAGLADAEELRRQGEPRRALAILSPLVSRHARGRAWLYLLRYRLKREAGLSGAARDVDLAFRADPGCAWVFGLAPLPEGLPPEAVLLQDAGFSERPECGPVLAYLGQALLARGQAEEGAAALERGARLEPAGWILAWLGEAERRQGRLEAAIARLTQALQADPRYGNAYAWRGTARLARGDAAGAKEDLERALRLMPGARAWLDLSRALRRLGDWLGAARAMEKAARLNAEYGWDLPSEEGLSRSLRELEAAQALHPREAWFPAWRGETLLRLGRVPEALSALNQALGLSPRHAWALAWRAAARLELSGENAAAGRDLARAAALDPGYARTHELSAEFELRQGRPERAAACLRRAIRANPYSARLYLARAKAELALGRSARARDDQARARRLCPEPAQARGLKTMEFFVNYSCNAKCPFCFNPPDASAELERGLPFAELARRMAAGYAAGYRAIKFIGGEVTIREDLPKLLALARRVGYRSIQITTNGIRLGDPAYARRLVALGADSFRFSVHGHTPELHDSLVRVPGALRRIRAAVETLRPLGVQLGINYVLNAVNYREFPETCRWFRDELGISDVIVYFLRYQGFAELPQNRELLSLRMSDAVPYVREAFRALDDGRRVPPPTLIHLPPCVLPELTEHLLDWTKDPEGCGQGATAADRVTLPDGSGGLIHDVTNSGKRPVAACASCAHRDRCLGVESRYVELFGESEFVPVSAAAEARR